MRRLRGTGGRRSGTGFTIRCRQRRFVIGRRKRRRHLFYLDLKAFQFVVGIGEGALEAVLFLPDLPEGRELF